jgi:hypothetical protein
MKPPTRMMHEDDGTQDDMAHKKTSKTKQLGFKPVKPHMAGGRGQFTLPKSVTKGKPPK